MNLLNKYNGIIEKYGYGVLLVHQDKSTRCPFCYDEKTQSADRDCPVCYGLGYLVSIKKEMIRDVDAGVPMTLPLINTANLYGNLAVATRAYFFQNTSVVTEGDLIIDVDWVDGTPTYNGFGIYQVAHVDPQRFEKGELIFYKVYVKDNPIEKSIRGINIMDKYGDTEYQLELEG